MPSNFHFQSLSVTLIATLGFVIGSPVRAQDSIGLPGKPRSTNERVVTQSPTPPPANSDALRAAEGRLAPGTNGAIDPIRALGNPDPARGAAMDPAMRLDPAGRSLSTVDHASMGVALLIQHALGMAIEGSALRTISEQSAGPGGDPRIGKELLDHANHSIVESEKLLGQASADGAALTSNPMMRRFHSAANAYISTLVSLEKASPAEKAQVAMINHSVKEAIDAGHILRISPAAGGSGALEQLVRHAAAMKSEGTQAVNRMAGNWKIEPNNPARVADLAVRGREVIDAADHVVLTYADAPANPGVGLPADPNPGRFQNDRPQIIGGTYGTGSPGTGTTRAVPPISNETKSRINRDGSPVPTPPNGDTNGSTGGLNPRQ